MDRFISTILLFVVSINRNNSTNDKPSAEQKKELPPELAGLFDDLKKSVLTNSKK